MLSVNLFASLCCPCELTSMSKFIKICLLSSLAGVSFTLFGCSNASSADQVSAVAAESAPVLTQGNWDIQPDGSYIRFTAKQEGEPFTGEFETFTGLINFDPNAPEKGEVRISIPLSSVEAGSNDRNSTLPGKIWFSAKKFPTAMFTSSDISTVDAAYVAKGELSLKGVSVPLSLPFNLDIDGKKAVMTSRLEIDRTLWNVGSDPWNTDEWVSRAVELDIQLTALRTD